MTDIHLFQRYTSKEDVLTNATLLLLSQVYQSSPTRLGDVIEGVIDDAQVSLPAVGVTITQQERGPKSVPDGLISQAGFKLLIEAKLHADVSAGQLRGHATAFDKEDVRLLFVLTPTPVPQERQQEIREGLQVADDGIDLVFATFRDVLAAVDAVVDEHDVDLRPWVEDYERFLSHQGVLPKDDRRLRAVPCGRSHEENIAFALYYEPTSRSSRPSTYLGVYYSKAIRAIGEIAKTAVVTIEDGAVHADPKLTEDEEQRILGAAAAAKEKRGWDLGQGLRFYLADRMHETEFRKESKGGMRGQQYFDLVEILGEEALDLPPDRIAELLKEEHWK